MLGANDPGLACRSIRVGTLDTNIAVELVRAVDGADNCAETVTGPAVVDVIVVVAQPTGTVCGTVMPTVEIVVAANVPRVVLNVTV